MNERTIFLEALDKENPDVRRAFLDDACGDDRELRGRVEELLAAHLDAPSFLERPPPGLAPTIDTSMPSSDSASPQSPVVGDKLRYFGDYELLEEIARGGMGVVYKATQVSLNRTVALKMTLSGRLASDADVRRFHAEAEAAANLDHPSIVPIYEVGQFEGQHYFSMKLVEGNNLTEHLSKLRDDFKAIARLIANIARAVHHAHQRGILHRDLKPGNVLIDADGNPHVTDFGIAKRIETDSTLTHSGAIMGTPSYISPEQARGEKQLTTAADVYSLGAVLFHLLAGRPAFQGNSPSDVLLGVLNREPPRPAALNRKVPGDLNTICLKCLEKQPERRYASAAALADDLERWLRHKPIVARSTGPVVRTGKWIRRHPALTSLLLMAVLAVIGITWQWYRAETQRGRAERERELAEHRVYVHHIALAQHEWLAGNLDYGDHLLNDCAEDDRHWEWHYMKRLCQPRLRYIKGHSNDPTSVAFSPDARYVATASKDKTVIVWDVATGKEILTLGHNSSVLSVAYSPDGQFLATVSPGDPDRLEGHADNVVTLWDAKRGIAAYHRAHHSDWGGGAAFGPDGLCLAIPVDGNAIVIWNPTTGDDSFRIDGVEHCDGLAISPDGERLAAVIGKTVKIWSIRSGEEQCSMTASDWHRAVVFNPDATRIATYQGVWNAATGEKLCLWLDKPGPGEYRCGSIVFTRDGKRVISCGIHRYIRVNDAATGEEQISLDHMEIGLKPTLAISSDGNLLASVGGDGVYQQWFTRLCIWDLAFIQPETVLPPHDLPVTGVRLSPDGRYVAAVSNVTTFLDILGPGPGETSVWDNRTGRAVKAFDRRNSSLPCMAVSRDGKLLARARFDNTVKVWSAAQPEYHVELQGHTDTVRSMAFFGPRGDRIATGSDDKTVKVWDVSSGKTLMTLVGHNRSPASIAISPDGKLIASATAVFDVNGAKTDDEIARSSAETKVWNATTGEEMFTLDGGYAVTFSPDGRQLATADNNPNDKPARILIWDMSNGKESAAFPSLSQHIAAVSWSGDGERIAAASSISEWAEGIGKVNVWNVATGKELYTRADPGGVATAIALSADCKQLATADRFGYVSWDSLTTGGINRPQLPVGGIVRSLSYVGESELLALTREDGTTRIMNPSNPYEKPSLRVAEKAAHAADWSIDGRLATACWDNAIRVWQMGTEEPQFVLRGHTGLIRQVAWNPDGHCLASAGDDKKIIIWDTHSGKHLCELVGHDGEINSVAWHPDGEQLASASADGIVKLWDTQTGKETRTFAGVYSSLRGNRVVSWSPNGRWLLATEAPGRILLWDMPSGTNVSGGFRSGPFAWSPDGNRLATSHPGTQLVEDVDFGQGGYSVDTVAVWDLDSGQQKLMDSYHDGQITALAFSPDGRRIASAGTDSSVKLWDVAAGQETMTLRRFNDWVLDVTFSPDGQRIVAGTKDGTCKVFDAATIEQRLEALSRP